MKAIKGKPFFRGIHPEGHKSLAAESPIEDVAPGDIVAISLVQHIGKPARPLVNVGDEVLVGQLIGEADGPISANIYSSVSGTVTDLETRANPKGAKSQYVIIKNDGNYEKSSLPPMADFSPSAIVERIRTAGIVGMGGAGFPTAVKLSPKTPVDTLIINCAECEPYLTCDYRLMMENNREIARGIRLLASALGVKDVIVAVEANKPKAIELFEQYDDMKVVILRKSYPMGSEKHLIYCCTGRKVGLGKLPSDVGCVVQNAATAFAVYEAVDLNKPLYERIVTVSGHGIFTPKNLRVKFGTNFETLLDKCGGLKENVDYLICGGPMMGATMLSTDYYTRKTDSGILALSTPESEKRNPTPCINCGACARVCPMKLQPMVIDFYTQSENYEAAKEQGGVLNCIECGCCAYVCPAKRSLVQSITLAKTKLREKK